MEEWKCLNVKNAPSRRDGYDGWLMQHFAEGYHNENSDEWFEEYKEVQKSDHTEYGEDEEMGIEP